MAPIERREQIEERISSIWATHLHLESIPRGATFSELGGHSLRAVDLACDVAEHVGLPMLRRRLLTLTTVEEQAAFLIELSAER